MARVEPLLPKPQAVPLRPVQVKPQAVPLRLVQVKRLLTAVSVSSLMLAMLVVLSVFRLLILSCLLVKRSTVQLIGLWWISPVVLKLFKTQ